MKEKLSNVFYVNTFSSMEYTMHMLLLIHEEMGAATECVSKMQKIYPKTTTPTTVYSSWGFLQCISKIQLVKTKAYLFSINLKCYLFPINVKEIPIRPQNRISFSQLLPPDQNLMPSWDPTWTSMISWVPEIKSSFKGIAFMSKLSHLYELNSLGTNET